ncbi:MAG TPA: hypothetical protein DD719_04705, partial [Desulfotomaculum sp.]|nr:hypothetical protein [Desulfotomaculum sp.]
MKNEPKVNRINSNGISSNGISSNGISSIEALFEKGKKQGILTYNEIMDSLQDVDL